MKIQRLTYEPGSLLEFYQDGLGMLGAVCERTWYDRLEILAEGAAAGLWGNVDGTLHQVELHFTPAEATSARDSAREVFPGCPLTFRLAEALRPAPLALERFGLPDTATRPPDAEVGAKLWRAQFPDTARWVMATPFKADYHFSLVCLVRCEIQAIDQHWSLHRVALSLPDGEPDDGLAREMGFQQPGSGAGNEIAWPCVDPAQWNKWLQQALEQELAEDVARVRARQEKSLLRELERVDAYFDNYRRELEARASRSSSPNTKAKTAERLASAESEHARRRADQVARHEIRVQPHTDALLLVAEKAWSAQVLVQRAHREQKLEALFVPRSRRWVLRSTES